jgi:type I restriction enzyme S subunit
MSEWVTTNLDAVLEYREGPGIMAAEFRNSGVPLVRLAGLKRGVSMLTGCNYLAHDLVDRRYLHFRLRLGDVLLSTSASLGEVARVSHEAIGAIPYTGIIAFRPKTTAIHPTFVEWMLRAPSFKAQVEAMGAGSVMKHFGPSHLKKMTVSYPGISTQKAIGEMMGALDAKLASNSIASSQADVYSSKLFEAAAKNGLSVPLSSLARFINGGAFTRKASGTGRVVIRIAELNKGLGASTIYSDAVAPETQTAYAGDILFSWSGSLSVHQWTRDSALINQHIFKVLPSGQRPPWLVYEAIRESLGTLRAIAADKATTMGHIKREHLDMPVNVPTPDTIKHMHQDMTNLWQLRLRLEKENHALALVRETLLFALFAGKVGLQSAERAVTDVL